MVTVVHDIRLGALTVSNTSDRASARMLRLCSELTMDGVGVARVVLAPGEYELPETGAVVALSLDSGDGSRAVFSGAVLEIECAALEVRVTAVGGLGALGRIECARAFEHAKAGDIARALLNLVGATAGTIEAGPSFPSYILHRGPSALQHLWRLARLCGVDVFEDADGRVHFAGVASRGAEHRLQARARVLALTVSSASPSRTGATVWGEGAASTKGAERAHWLAAELTSVSATTRAEGDDFKDSRNSWTLSGAVRSGEVASTLAKAQVRARSARGLRGEFTVTGAPRIVPGDVVVLDALPREHAASALVDGVPLRARAVQHSLGPRTGYVTRVEF